METHLPVVCGRPRDPAEVLFLANQGLIGAVMRRFSGLPPGDRDDAEALARLGLLHAAKRFDPAKGFAFSTFAMASIWGHVMRAMRETAQQGRVPCVSLDAPVPCREGDVRADLLPDPCDPYAAARDAESFEARLAVLSPRQRRLVRAVFADELTLTEAAQSEAAHGGGAAVTRQRCKQQLAVALWQLRQEERAQGGQE